MEHLIITADGKLEAENWLDRASDERQHKIEMVLQGRDSWESLIELLLNGFLCAANKLQDRAIRHLLFLHRNCPDNRVLRHVCQVIQDYKDPEIRLPILEWVSRLDKREDDLISDIIFIALEDDSEDVRARAVDAALQLCWTGIHFSDPVMELLEGIEIEAKGRKDGYSHVLSHVKVILKLQLPPWERQPPERLQEPLNAESLHRFIKEASLKEGGSKDLREAYNRDRQKFLRLVREVGSTTEGARSLTELLWSVHQPAESREKRLTSERAEMAWKEYVPADEVDQARMILIDIDICLEDVNPPPTFKIQTSSPVFLTDDSDQVKLQKLVEHGESSTVEFKEKPHSLEGQARGKFVKHLSAIANTGQWDGHMIYGVLDPENHPHLLLRDLFVGMEPGSYDDQQAHQASELFCNPPVEFAYCEAIFRFRVFGVIQIPRSRRRPHQATKNIGALRQGVIYIRDGSDTRYATREEICEMCTQPQTYAECSSIT